MENGKPESPEKKGYFNKWPLIGIIAAIAILAWLIPGPGDDDINITEKDSDPTAVKKVASKLSDDGKAVIYTASPDSENLTPTIVKIDKSSTLENRMKFLLTKIFNPENRAGSPFPSGMTVETVFLYDNIAVISLDGQFRRKMSIGIWTELLAVYSIVNTLTESFSEIEKVHILIDGAEAEFFVSHVMIDRPLRPDTSYIQKSS